MNNNINNMNNNSNNNKMFNNLNNMNFNNMKTYNVINMNENKNLIQINNIQNNNMVNSQENLMSFYQNNNLKIEVENNTNLNEQLVFLIFIIEKYNRYLFIEVNENDKFEEVIKKLEEKYSWLATINNKLYIYDKKQISNFNMTLNELGIVDDSEIKIEI